MTLEQFQEWALKNGYTQDRFGHFHKVDRRFKVQARSIRLEKSYTIPAGEYSPAEKRWLRLATGYLSKITITAEGKLSGFTR